MKRVRVGAPYWFQPVGWDRFRPTANQPEAGAFVRVVNLPGCPRAGTMGHCYVQDADGRTALVLLASLQPLPDAYCRRHCWKLSKADRARTRVLTGRLTTR